MRSAQAITRGIAALAAMLLLDSCPTEPKYPSTITPIYAATGDGLFVYNGSSWAQYSTTLPSAASSHLASDTATSVVVSGSGSQAEVFVGTDAGVSLFNGSGWKSWTTSDGLGSNSINQLFLTSSELYAATASGLSYLNLDGSSPTWSSTTALSPITSLYVYGNYVYAAADQLYVYNGASQVHNFSLSSLIGGSSKVTALYVDSSQDIFIGTDAGFNVEYVKSGAYISGTALTTIGSVSAIVADSSGDLFIGSTDGIFELAYGNSNLVQLTSKAPRCLAVDGSGAIYAGTSSGLQRSTDGGSTWTTILSGHAVRSVVTTAPLYSF